MADAAPARSRRRDLTQGPILRTLVLFALPTLGSNVLQSLNGSINAVWVGRFLGANALAATSNANLILFMAFAGVFGFGIAAAVLVGQSVGRRDFDGARRAGGTAFGALTLFAIIVAAIGWWLSPAILDLLQTPPEVRALAIAYLRVIFLGLPPSMLAVLIGMVLRGYGDAVTPLWFVTLGVVLDAGLNPLLIAGIGPFPRLGIAGSAMATLLANYATLIATLVYVYARDLPIRLKGREFAYLNPDAGLARIIVGRGLPMALQLLMMSVSALSLIGLVNRQGVLTVAAYAVAQQLWTYVQMPAVALGGAVSAMAAQNIGAGRWDRVGRTTVSGVAVSVAMTTTLILIMLLVDRQLFALFLGSGSPAIGLARYIQLVVSWSFIIFGVTLVLFGVTRANGAVWPPLFILTFALLGVRLAFAYGLEPRLGADAIWFSFPAGSVTTLVLSIRYYRRGRWREGGIAAALDRAEATGDGAARDASTSAEPAGRLNPTA